MAAGAGGTEDENSLPNGIRTSPVTSAVVVTSRDQPNKRARGTTAYAVTSTRGPGGRIAHLRPPVPLWCGAAESPKDLTSPCKRLAPCSLLMGRIAYI
jgi:hypothetical protein